nr:hypothetical protein Iba_chr05aCG18000 [Ipomoea batatas]GMC96590.1 hypothetical protein Iba_chr05cCG19420 [Ipomoea batatas]
MTSRLKFSRSKINLKIQNSLKILLLSCYKVLLIWILHFKLSRKLILEGT